MAPATLDRMLFLPPAIAPIDAMPAGREIAFGGEIFATSWSVRLCFGNPFSSSERRASLQARCEAALSLVDCQMSPWIEDSDLCRYNRLADGDSAILPEPMRGIVAGALEVSDQTRGLFDPFVGAATDLWGFGPPAVAEGLPPREALRALQQNRARRDRPRLAHDRLERRDGYRLDLCGIAKGYAVDLLMDRMLAESDVASVLVEVGGELKGRGIKPDGMPWWVDLDWPGDGETGQMRIGLHGWACASSGINQRYFDHGGRRYSHAIDPVTGEPARSDLQGVSVLDPQCWRADALATALLVAGLDRAMALADRLDIPCLLVPATEGRGAQPRCSAALEKWLEPA